MRRCSYVMMFLATVLLLGPPKSAADESIKITTPPIDDQIDDDSNLTVTGTTSRPNAMIGVQIKNSSGVVIQSGSTSSDGTGAWSVTLSPPNNEWPVGTGFIVYAIWGTYYDQHGIQFVE